MQQNFKLNGRPRMAIKDFYARSRRVGPHQSQSQQAAGTAPLTHIQATL